MKGFIRNETNKSVFRVQRSLPANGVLSFENAYLSVGQKSGKSRGPAFVKWLKENYFDEEGWRFYKEDGTPFFQEKSKKVDKPTVGEEDTEVSASPRKTKKVAPAKGAGKKLVKKRERASAKTLTAGSIIEADLVQAREMIGKVRDRAVLKKALSLSNHFSHKEDHRRLIQRRLEEVY
jgi:hypothetical protein